MNSSFNHSLLAVAISVSLLSGTAQAGAEMPTTEDLMRLIQQQNAMIEKLSSKVESLEQNSKTVAADAAAAKRMADENAEAVAATAEAVEAGTSGGSSWSNDTSIGGYGELHYNNLNGSGGASDKDQIDFHRFVLFFGHEFTDRLRFFSELELEHSLAGDGKPGEVELEQAYLDYDLNDNTTARAGLFILPVGIMNETHEPDTFYGVERNNVEKNIIPTTWWEGGFGVHGRNASGFSYDAYVHSGLAVKSDYLIRGGRQKVAEAPATDPAFTARVRYTGVPGLALGVTAQYQSDLTQEGANGAPESSSATLIEAHAVYEKGPFGLRALYARWDLDADAAKALGRDEQTGFYIEPSYRVNNAVGVFARYSSYDNEAGDSSLNGEKNQYDIGVNWWLHENAVIKADYQIQDNDNGRDQDGFNLGVGYSF